MKYSISFSYSLVSVGFLRYDFLAPYLSIIEFRDKLNLSTYQFYRQFLCDCFDAKIWLRGFVFDFWAWVKIDGVWFYMVEGNTDLMDGIEIRLNQNSPNYSHGLVILTKIGLAMDAMFEILGVPDTTNSTKSIT